jgi:hypothetical protein
MSKTQAMEDPTPLGVYTAIDRILSGNEAGLIRGIFTDFTPPTKGAQASGLSWGSIFSAIGFALRHPLDTYRLMGFIRSEGYKAPAFQEKLLNNDKLWDALDTAAPDALPQIGRIAASFMSDTPPVSVSTTAASTPIPSTTTPPRPLISAEAVENLRGNPRLRVLLANNAEGIKDLAFGLQDKYPIKTSLERFGIAQKAFDFIPWGLKQ